MTGEEMERTMAFILGQQAQLTGTVGGLAERVVQISVRVERLGESVERIAEKVERIAEKVERNAEGISALLAIAQIHDREIKETDERLNALINTVERHISEGRNGRA